MMLINVEITLEQGYATLKEYSANLFQRRFRFRHQRCINFMQVYPTSDFVLFSMSDYCYFNVDLRR